ncbi:MAG: hypothetical protein LBS07_00935 [Prevotellaceae bacterium]|jgi:hypothetical protein|nr:hypothetical protein [Prevotellaceae bacterium]
MEKHSVITTWKGGMAFEAGVDGHPVIMDAKPEFGGNNAEANPKQAKSQEPRAKSQDIR